MSLGDPKSQKQLEPRSLVGSTVLSRFFWMECQTNCYACPHSPHPSPPQLGDGLMSHPL